MEVIITSLAYDTIELSVKRIAYGETNIGFDIIIGTMKLQSNIKHSGDITRAEAKEIVIEEYNSNKI